MAGYNCQAISELVEGLLVYCSQLQKRQIENFFCFYIQI
jgi:hypothetical protein